MIDLQIQIGELPLIINVGIRLLTAFVFAAFLIPLLVKEAKVRNGLRTLRYEMLAAGILIFLINTLGLGIIIVRFLGIDIQLITDMVTYFNSVGFLCYAIINLRVYTKKYTPANKALHARFEKIENKALQDVEDKKKNK